MKILETNLKVQFQYKPPWLVFIDETGTDRRDAIFVGLGIAYEANQRRLRTVKAAYVRINCMSINI